MRCRRGGHSMAAIVQQRTQEESAARTFWNSKMQAHPNIAGAVAVGQEIASFFLNGHCIVALARWVIRVSGYVAESALLFAVLWISATSVAPQLVELFISAQLMQRLIWLALVTLALIPEIILGNAIINAAARWLSVVRDRHSVMAWVWAIAFTIPTLLFLILTALTLNTLASADGNVVQASAGLVGLRCFAGWSYGLLELVYTGIGRRTLNQAQPMITPAQLAPAAAQIDSEEIARQLLPLVAQEVRQAIPDTTGIGEQLHQLRVNVEEIATRIARQSETEDEKNITSFEDAKVHLKHQNDETELETNVEIETRPTPRVKVKLKQERSAAKRASSVETKSETNNARGTARQKALRVLKRNPEINASELAKRVGITPQYASQILKQQSS